MALNRLVEEAARDVRRRIETRLPGRLLELRVFGSQARGEAKEDSDVDLFVLLDERDVAADKAIAEAVYETYTAYEYELFLAPLIMSGAHFQDLVRRERLIARNILDEGVVIT